MRSIPNQATITRNYLALADQLNELAAQSQRPANSVRLLAVSKTRSIDEIRVAFAAGARDVGENYLQEALPKREALGDLKGLRWHFIGAIQSNKTAAIAQAFDWVHTLDRTKIAQRLNRQRPAELAPLNVCININLHDEPSKAGIAPTELPDLIASVQDCERLRLRGLMAIPAPSVPPRESFETLAQLFHNVAPTASEGQVDRAADWDSLSMGMSGDYAAAIAAGSTMVRIGTALFGPRS